MALLSFEKEMARGSLKWPFSKGVLANGTTELDSWKQIWCVECRHEKACPLLEVIIFGRTPAAWEDRNPGALNRYHCQEFEAKEGDAGEAEKVLG